MAAHGHKLTTQASFKQPPDEPEISRRSLGVYFSKEKNGFFLLVVADAVQWWKHEKAGPFQATLAS
jgi:hypothetical protein